MMHPCSAQYACSLRIISCRFTQPPLSYFENLSPNDQGRKVLRRLISCAKGAHTALYIPNPPQIVNWTPGERQSKCPGNPGISKDILAGNPGTYALQSAAPPPDCPRDAARSV